MNPKRKADLRGIGFELKTNFTGGENKAFSIVNSTTGLEPIAAIISRVIRDRRTAPRFDWKRRTPGRIKAL